MAGNNVCGSPTQRGLPSIWAVTVKERGLVSLSAYGLDEYKGIYLRAEIMNKAILEPLVWALG